MTSSTLTPPHSPTQPPTQPLSPPLRPQMTKCVTREQTPIPEVGEDSDWVSMEPVVRNSRFLSSPEVRDSPCELEPGWKSHYLRRTTDKRGQWPHSHWA